MRWSTVSNILLAKLLLPATDSYLLGVQFGGDEVVKAKDGAGSATLSMAYAGFRSAFTSSLPLRSQKNAAILIANPS